ncbi:MAG: hypothetical protein IJD73_01190 [Clostridia bacterium]|nr:hypothetical protein [Clostridia bacterium]
MPRVFATFLKKGSAKNFPTGKILGCFSKKVRSTVVVNRRAFFVLITLSGYAVTNLILQSPSLKVFCFVFFKKRMGFGATPHKTAFSFCKAFSFAPFVPKEKAMWG